MNFTRLTAIALLLTVKTSAQQQPNLHYTISMESPSSHKFHVTLHYTGPDAPTLRELFDRLEFRTLGSRLPSVIGGAPEPVIDEGKSAIPWRLVPEGPELEQWVDQARKTGAVAIRTLQVGGEGRRGQVTTIALSAGEDTIVVCLFTVRTDCLSVIEKSFGCGNFANSTPGGANLAPVQS